MDSAKNHWLDGVIYKIYMYIFPQGEGTIHLISLHIFFKEVYIPQTIRVIDIRNEEKKKYL